MDGEGAAFAKRRQLPRRKSQMASRGMEEAGILAGYFFVAVTSTCPRPERLYFSLYVAVASTLEVSESWLFSNVAGV